MKIFESSWLPPPAKLASVVSCLLAAAAAAAGPSPSPQPTPPVSVRPTWLYSTDDRSSIAIRLPADSENGEVLVAVPPLHGSLELQPGAAIYYPHTQPMGPSSTAYIGRDSLTLVAGGVALEVELRILPRFISFVGSFDGYYQAAALWDNQQRRLLLCGEPAPGAEELPCELWPVTGLTAGPFVPLAWPDLSGKDSPILFDPATGRFLALERRAGHFAFAGFFDIQAILGGWPVRGDFDGTGRPALAMVKENGDVLTFKGKRWESWPHKLSVPKSDALVWPVVLSRLDGDALALVDSASHSVRWLRIDPVLGPDSGIEAGFHGDDLRRPLGWSKAPTDGLLPGFEILFLTEAEDGSLQLVPGDFYPGDPQTIPVKFPDDPSGGG